MYKTCIEDWNKVTSFITNEGQYKCRCGTYWKEDKFIAKAGMCCNCDNSSQPFLSNPRNKHLVMKYIDPKYWEFILSTCNDSQTLDK
jgi:hypothetical protein